MIINSILVTPEKKIAKIRSRPVKRRELRCNAPHRYINIHCFQQHQMLFKDVVSIDFTSRVLIYTPDLQSIAYVAINATIYFVLIV